MPKKSRDKLPAQGRLQGQKGKKSKQLCPLEGDGDALPWPEKVLGLWGE